MKAPILFLAAITLSTAVFAGNMQQDTKSSASMQGDMSSMHSNMTSMHNNMNSMHSGMNKEATQTEVLKNKDMQRLHREMTRNGMSEGGMEARVDMMTEKGRAFHRALEQDQKNTAG
ncbi:hypothetical protein [Marinobacter sp. ELB17]|uniref:hypothetical protein n=1 Tax=Marinobacter sp. ELB17 TaxID=270374 RepID=UPI0000F39A46|nr:hypothetical protein [Marinobacter sp. ELB17]EAZ99687.1 hypothetical protein MELB17_11806 [Marinobacter sp. ELB17]